jgi:hypothetical protein
MGIQTQKSLGVECQVSPTSRGQEEEKEPTDELREVKWVGVELGQWQIRGGGHSASAIGFDLRNVMGTLRRVTWVAWAKATPQ